MYRNRYSIDYCKVGFSSVSYFGLTWFQENGREFPHVTKETWHCSVFCNNEEDSVINKCCQVKPVAFHHILLSTVLFLGNKIKDFKSTPGISVMFSRDNPWEITWKFRLWNTKEMELQPLPLVRSHANTLPSALNQNVSGELWNFKLNSFCVL